MTASAAQFAFLAFFKTPRSSSSPYLRFRSHFRILNQYIPLSTGAVTEVRALPSTLLAPHRQCQPLVHFIVWVIGSCVALAGVPSVTIYLKDDIVLVSTS